MNSYVSLKENKNIFGGYFPSWNDRFATSGENTDLANLPSYINLVIVSFGLPDMNYTGNLNLKGTGLSFPYSGPVLKTAIKVLKLRRPKTKVILSIGGETYYNWISYNPKNIAKCVKDFGFDGIDLDYEPKNGFVCSMKSNKRVSCTTDKDYSDLVINTRKYLPKPYILTAAPFSVGAYGEGRWEYAQPAKVAGTGMFLNVMKYVGHMLDYINVQGYNAGSVYDPLQGAQAYFDYFGNGVLIGAHVPPEAWGNHVWTVNEINRVGSFVNKYNLGGMMMWQLYRKTKGPSKNNPDGQIMASAIAKVLGFPNYYEPLFPLRK